MAPTQNIPDPHDQRRQEPTLPLNPEGLISPSRLVKNIPLPPELVARLQIGSLGFCQDFFKIFYRLTVHIAAPYFTPEFLRRVRHPQSAQFKHVLDYTGPLTGLEACVINEISTRVTELPQQRGVYESCIATMLVVYDLRDQVTEQQLVLLAKREVTKFDGVVRRINGLNITPSDDPRSQETIRKLNHLSRLVALAGRYMYVHWKGDRLLPATSRSRYVAYGEIPSSSRDSKLRNDEK